MHTSAHTQQVEARCIKLIVLGIASVGKSSLLLRLTDQQWLPEEERIPTIGVDTLVNLFAFGLLFRVGRVLTFSSLQGAQIRCERKKGRSQYLGECITISCMFATRCNGTHRANDDVIGHGWRRAPPCHHLVVLSRHSRHHPRCVNAK
jgi:hypothetical protein